MGTKRQEIMDKVNKAHWFPSVLNIGRAAVGGRHGQNRGIVAKERIWLDLPNGKNAHTRFRERTTPDIALAC